jgi:glutamyl-tRNA reductase
MHIVVVGMNYRSAPLELRERLAFRPEQIPSVLGRLRQDVGLSEAAILSTCNRVEIYAGAPQLDGTVDRLHAFLGRHGGIEPAGFSSSLYSLVEPHSVRHLFSVASGLDSMVLGEAEILRQVKDAYEAARAAGTTGKALNGLFQRAMNTAKSVRSQTGIGHGSTSVGSVAVQLSEKIFGGLSNATVVLIGAGKIGELTLKRLAERGAGRLRILSRTAERAEELALGRGAEALGYGAIDAQLLDADIIITSTIAPGYLLDRARLSDAMRARHQRPLCVVDLGVPRNVEPSAGSLENVYLFNVDDLQELLAHQQHERQRAVGASEQIIDQKVHHFIDWWQEEFRHAGADVRDRHARQLIGAAPGADGPDQA